VLRLVTLACAVCAGAPAPAANADEKASPETLANTIRSDLAPRNLLRLQPSYRWLNDGNSTDLLVRLRLRYHGVILPGLDLPPFFSLLRVDFRLRSLNRSKASAGGLADMDLIDLVTCQAGWGVIGFGLAAVLPTATDGALGAGVFQLGPAAGLLVERLHPLALDLLVRSFSTVAARHGRETVTETLIRPGVAVSLPTATTVRVQSESVIDWENGGRTRVSIETLVGHAFTKHLALELGGEVIVAGPTRGDGRVLLRVDFGGW
jgi:hypothetical protein